MKFSEFLAEVNYRTQADTIIERINEFNEGRGVGQNFDLTGYDTHNIPVQIKDMPNGEFNVSENQLTSFENFPKEARYISARGNKFTTLHNIHKYIHRVPANFGLDLCNNPIESSVLGLLLIKDLPSVSFDNFKGGVKLNQTLDKVNTIINKYLPNTRGNEAVYECQEELIDAGYEEYAQL